MTPSLQAQILRPMAISLAFGVVFATAITLLLVPCSYLVIEDFQRWRKRPDGLQPQAVTATSRDEAA